MLGPKLATKCLTWVMTLLALLPSLQGSALACHLGACHSASASRSHACCFKHANSDSRREVGDRIDIAAPTPPCKCPISCWCRRPAQAVIQVSESVHFAIENQSVPSWTQVVASDAAKPIEAAPAIPKSSQQVCAVLCRFLA
jgi:hypothetical protein